MRLAISWDLYLYRTAPIRYLEMKILYFIYIYL